MWPSKNETLGKTTATLYIMYKIMFHISGGGDTCYSVWYSTEHFTCKAITFFSQRKVVFLWHSAHRVCFPCLTITWFMPSRFWEGFFCGQVLDDDHGSPDNGKPHVNETPENPLAAHHIVYAFAKHFVILIRNRTNEGLNTISFHGLIPDTYHCFHQLCLRLPWNGYTLWSYLVAELGSSF